MLSTLGLNPAYGTAAAGGTAVSVYVDIMSECVAGPSVASSGVGNVAGGHAAIECTSETPKLSK